MRALMNICINNWTATHNKIKIVYRRHVCVFLVFNVFLFVCVCAQNVRMWACAVYKLYAEICGHIQMHIYSYIYISNTCANMCLWLFRNKKKNQIKLRQTTRRKYIEEEASAIPYTHYHMRKIKTEPNECMTSHQY